MGLAAEQPMQVDDAAHDRHQLSRLRAADDARSGGASSLLTMIIAIDGPAASGKGTLAKRLAVHYGLPHLDTGLLYRAVARALMDFGHPLDDEAAAVRAAQASTSRISTRRACAAARWARRPPSSPRSRRCARRWSDWQRAFARRPRGRGARRPRHRHGDLPGRRREDLRHGAARGARPPPLSRARGARRGRDATTTCWPTSASATRAIRAAAPPRSPPRADARLLDTTSLDIEQAFRAAVGFVEAARQDKRLVVSRTDPRPPQGNLASRFADRSRPLSRNEPRSTSSVRAGPLKAGAPEFKSRGHRRGGALTQHQPPAPGPQWPTQENECPLSLNPRPAKISRRCSTNPSASPTPWKVPSSRASSSPSRRTWPSSTSA